MRSCQNVVPADAVLQSPRSRHVFLPLLLISGLALALEYRRRYNNGFPPAMVAQILLLPVVLAVSFITPLRAKIARLIESARSVSRSAKIAISITLFVISFLYLWGSAVLHGRDLSPRIQDEFSYLIQAQLLARGKLWLPSPPLTDFFETFHVLVKPVYASVYFPGTAMLYVPGVWLGVPHYFTSLTICALSVALFYVLVTELLDGACGLLAAAMLLSTHMFFYNSTLAMPNIPVMLLAMIALLAWLRWRCATTSDRRTIWAIIIGIACGWAAITRPLDLLAYALPLAILIMRDLRTMPRAALASIVAMILAVMPFVAMQLVFDKGVTGHWLKTPYNLYFEQSQPNTSFGFVKPDEAANAQLQTKLPQKIDLYESFLRPLILEHHPSMIGELMLRWRLKFAASSTMPSFLLIALLPLGIVRALRNVTTALLFGGVPLLWLGLYTSYPYPIPYYGLAIAPPVMLLLLTGASEIITDAGSPRSAVTVFTFAVIVALCLAAIPEFRLDLGPELYRVPGLNGLNQKIASDIRPPAVILFRYSRGASPHNEPVYNYTAADPLEAGVIRAQDLGEPRDREIIEYFAQHRPQTTFYRFDRGSEIMERLGSAGELASTLRASTQINRDAARQ